MNSQDLHTHSVWDDGQNTLEEMANAAVAANLDAIGFSGHSPLPYRNRWALQADRLEAYKTETRRLKALFAGKIEVYLGIEWDVMSTFQPTGFDYVIGSVHHVTVNGTIYSADATPETVETCLSDAFHGDADASARAYFSQLPALAKIPEVDIIGHFDLPTKFNETHGFYNEDSPAYTAAALEAMEALVAADKIFEINTGASSRGYRTTPYPSSKLLLELKRMGGRITINSDAHSVSGLALGFSLAKELARSCGFTERWIFNGTSFVPVGIE